MDMTEWNQGRLLGVSGSYWQACTLHAGVKLDVFSKIENGDRDPRQLADKLGLDVRALTMLLDALAAMSLLKKDKGRYTNTEGSRSLLIKGAPGYIGYMIMHHHHLVTAWSRLDEAVRSGGSVRSQVASDHEERESFLMGMFNNAMAIAPHLTQALDLSGRRHLLDLGGGPGTYAIHFCMNHPDLRATVADLPTTRPFAEKTIAGFGLSDRINFVSCDYLKEDIKGSYDVAWLSHIFHGEGPDACRMIMDKVVAAIEPEGLVLIHDFILNDTRDGPLFPALFSLNMLVNTERGQSYSDGEFRQMMTEAGLTDIRRFPFRGPNDSGILSGIR